MRPPKGAVLVGVSGLLGGALVLSGCDQMVARIGWFSRMADQRSVLPYEGEPLTAPPNAVPVSGREAAMTREELEALENPIPVTEISIARGDTLYLTYCLVCHGATGVGDGPVARKFVPPPDLSRTLPNRTDGYIYAHIRVGGPIMPAYGAMIPPEDRWHVVNYLRSLTQ